MDEEAYKERLAIMLEENPGADHIDMVREATQMAYATPFSIVCTAAIRDDWEPAKEMCRRESGVHGKQHALALWACIRDAVEAKNRLRGQ
jgi:hypothetical protein